MLLMFFSFSYGLYLSGRNEVVKGIAESGAVYAGKVLGKYASPTPGELSQDIDFNLFWEVWDSLDKMYVDKDNLNDKKMFYGAIRGMVAAVGDPYTVFMDPKLSKDFADDLSGTFEGIGAEVGIKDDVVTIVAPLPDMPAEKAGLKAGDKIIAINGTTTMGMTVDQAVSLIRGPKDTVVKLMIVRGKEQQKEYSVTRGKIVVKSVREEMREDGVYVIKVSSFNNDTVDLFNKAVKNVIAKDPKGLILDLRNNPGGYLEASIEMASEWINDGVIVTEKYNEDSKNEHMSRGRSRLEGVRTVVLINEGSASASEIVAGALQDTKKATVIGKKSFGKGSVQTLSNFKDGSSVKITVAKWLTPSGRSINEEGIEPDIAIDYTLEDYNAGKDPELEKSVDLLLGKISFDDLKKEMAVKASSTKATSTK